MVSKAAERWENRLDNVYYTAPQKNDTDIAHYNFDADQPIIIIFDRDVAERVCYETMIGYPTSPN